MFRPEIGRRQLSTVEHVDSTPLTWDNTAGDGSSRFQSATKDATAAASELTDTESGVQPKKTSAVRGAIDFVKDGGTVFDGFLLAASQEVGQSILTLPYVFSLVGFRGGIILEMIFATLALYTNFLLVSLHAQFRHKLEVTDDPRHKDPYFIVSYHDIMGGLVGEWAKKLSLVVVFFALFGLSTVQIIATSSNFYILDPNIKKRTWSLIWGGIFSLVCFIPNFRHYRVLSVLGILTTTYTAWYMTVESALQGPIQDVVYDAPRNAEEFFRGFVSLLFIFGGHTSNIEVADVMDDPATYDKSYLWSFFYVFTLTVPNAVSAYRTYGAQARNNANSFAMFPRTVARDIGIVLMSLHQLVAFGLFAGPLFHMWEKSVGIHDRPFWIRALCRLPLAGIMLLVAVAFPFFGAVNSILGAFTTSFGTYLIPLVAYNVAFRDHEKMDMVKRPPAWVNMGWMRAMNWTLAFVLMFAGVGVGGWSSITNFIRQIENFDYFAECYQC